MLSRADFLKLTGMDAEALKSRARRDQLPFADDGPRHPMRRRGYSPFEAFLTLLADDLAKEQHLAVRTACEIVNGAVPDLWRCWGRIGETSSAMASGIEVPPGDEILVGRVVRAGLLHPRPVCGTMAEIASAAVEATAPVRIVLTNASRGALVLRRRAISEAVQLSDSFWLANPEAPPQVSDFAAEAQVGWDRAIAAANAEAADNRRPAMVAGGESERKLLKEAHRRLRASLDRQLPPQREDGSED